MPTLRFVFWIVPCRCPPRTDRSQHTKKNARKVQRSYAKMSLSYDSDRRCPS
ncbi:hypothetical protein KNP414_07262 [Paenibacillus mucilaginosus KNP414]|uniref:Uncharacterized protein n=1 Tax=Paenibacillus mucilaginosus (strain KNP414) TaxID=1036673 RepID=F8FNZ3_PAEMK|nr:hypothetical protein KNP414_07262 [Paenibacillus mucilaginosus KNP414]